MGLAERVRHLRQRRVLSQAELAKRAGLTKVTITRIEGGDYRPQPRTLRKLAEALGVEPVELAEDGEAGAGSSPI